MLTRICSTCGEDKPLDVGHYHKKAGASHGFRKQCKKCCNDRASVYRKSSKAKIRRSRNKYGDDDMKCSMVEDEQYKKIKVPCWNADKGCKVELEILVDTLSNRRPPKKICGKCKSMLNDIASEPMYSDTTLEPSRLPFFDSMGQKG